MNWFDARSFCRRNGLDLVTIDSQYEQDSLTNYIEVWGAFVWKYLVY